jgi:hypothetical protein
MRTFQTLFCGCALRALGPQGAAHIRLLEPASWLQDAPNGDPQWLGPCGGSSANPGKHASLLRGNNRSIRMIYERAAIASWEKR